MGAPIMQVMTKTDAINFYAGNVSALARALGLDQSTVYSWGDFPPDKRQLQLERLTGGALTAEPGCLDRVTGLADADQRGA